MPGGFDLSVVLSQSSAVEKVQMIQNPNSDMQQQHFASRMKEEREHLRSDVQDTKGTEETKIHADQQGENRKRGTSDRHSSGESEEEATAPSAPLGIDEGQIIDITI